MQTTDIYETSQWDIKLKYPTPDIIPSQLDLTHLATEGVFTLAEGLLTPLKVDLSVSFFDREFDYPVGDISPPTPYWLLKQTNLPENISADTYWVAEDEQLVSAITPEKVSTFINQAVDCNKKNNHEHLVDWHQMIFNSNRCCLPINQKDLVEGCIQVKERSNTLLLPVELFDNKFWASGPMHPYSLYAPIEIFLEREMGEISLRIYLYWSIYTEEGSLGKQKVQTNVSKLLAQGWIIDEE